jgi:hypothetical protein
MSLKYR